MASFCIADKITVIDSLSNDQLRQLLPNLEPFLTDTTDETTACQIRLGVSGLEECGEVLSVIDTGEQLIRLHQLPDGYCLYQQSYYTQQCCIAHIHNQFQEIRCTLPADQPEAFLLNSLLMFCFSFSAQATESMMIHSSAVVYQGKAYLFLGPSGAGKSTHARLWQETFPDCVALNDDNPVIRRMPDGSFHAYGTAWSGKGAVYKNEHYPIAALVRIVQAPENRAEPVHGAKALTLVLPSCSRLQSNKELFCQQCDLLSLLVCQASVMRMYCLPNTEAARVCYESLQPSH